MFGSLFALSHYTLIGYALASLKNRLYQKRISNSQKIEKEVGHHQKGIGFWMSKCYTIYEVKEWQELNGKEIKNMEALEEMTEKEQKTMFISAYMNLQRVKVSEDKDKEIRNQERELKAKLEALGVVVEDLKIE